MTKRDYLRKDGLEVKDIKGDPADRPILPSRSHNANTLELSYNRVNKLVSDAIVLRQSGKENEARSKMVEAVDILSNIIKNMGKTNPRRKELEEQRQKYIDAVEELEKEIDRESENPSPILLTSSGTPVGEADDDDFYRNAVPIVRKDDMDDFPDLKDIVGLEDVKEKLEFEIDFPLENPELAQVMTGSRALLLYGPPGNGKTELARAVAKEKDVNFIYVRPSDIFNKYLGESNKFLRGIFEKAYLSEPCIIFIDEFDSIGSARNSDESEARRDVKNELLQQMQGFDRKKDSKVWVMAATNRPQDLDSAIAGRRFPTNRQIYVGLPSKKGRASLVKGKLRKDLPSIQKVENINYDTLAELLDGYSGSDITELVSEVRSRPARELFSENQQRKKEGKQPKKVPRAITMQDFRDAIISSPPSLSKQEVEEIRRWGDKNKKSLKVEEDGRR